MYARHARRAVEDAMGDTPVVLIVGGRQVGKSTLVASLEHAPGSGSVITLDDPMLRAAAVEDPNAFLRGFSGPLAIDEIQRAPELFLVIKMLVDEARLRGEQPAGQFLLTGSVAIWDTARMPDSLAGRIEHVRLWPLSQGEIEGRREDLIDRLFENDPPRLQDQPAGRAPVAERVVRGGFPEVQLRTLPRAAAWIRDYLALLLDRDIRELGQVRRPEDLLRLLTACAARVGSVVNVATMLADLGLSRSTGHRYYDVLRRLYLVHELPAWGHSLARTAVRSPKLLLTDTGVLCELLRLDAERFVADEALRPGSGAAFENFVAVELLKAAGWADEPVTAAHWREPSGREVDLLLERRDGTVVAVETKPSATAHTGDARHLAHLRDQLGERFRCGIVCYTGASTVA
ncbi:MAG: ATP-binding protein, partial [Patulibacter sp.]|nr:ATP-binding protein [Patulibacter sp.]